MPSFSRSGFLYGALHHITLEREMKQTCFIVAHSRLHGYLAWNLKDKTASGLSGTGTALHPNQLPPVPGGYFIDLQLWG